MARRLSRAKQGPVYLDLWWTVPAMEIGSVESLGRGVVALDDIAAWEPSRHVRLPGRPGEFHSEPPTDPDVNLSIHPARATQRRLPPSAETKGSSGFPLTQSQRG